MPYLNPSIAVHRSFGGGPHLGEDPCLGSIIAAAQARGFQGPDVGAPDGLMACMKHFAGYGASEAGRDYDSANLSDSELHNVHLPPFKAAVKAGAGSVMSAYMNLNDVPATANKFCCRTYFVAIGAFGDLLSVMFSRLKIGDAWLCSRSSLRNKASYHTLYSPASRKCFSSTARVEGSTELLLHPVRNGPCGST